MQPVIVRESVVMLVTAVQVVKRATKQDLWSVPRHHQLRNLELLGSRQTRKGLLSRPLLKRPQQTGLLLRKLLASNQPGEDLMLQMTVE